MPAYNAETTIRKAIASVLAGTFHDFEIVVCDDASSDSTQAISREFRDARVRVIGNERNVGEGPSRDRAIAAATGHWITMLDADDTYAPNRLEKLLTVATQHPDAVIFDEMMECHDTPTGPVPWRPVRNPSIFPGPKYATRRVAVADWIHAKRTLIKPFLPARLIHEFKIRHPPLYFAADLAFMLRLLSKSHAALWYVPEPLYLYRLSAGSMSTANNRYALLAQVLGDAIPSFDWNPAMQRAIRDKLAAVHDDGVYHDFFSAVMNGQLPRAGRRAIEHPWVLSEFCWRSIERIPYHLSRWWHSGARRQTT